MPHTTFPNEVVLLTVRKNVLVEVDTVRQSTRKRMMVAINSKGNTDYPLLTATGVLWDNPERYPKDFRLRASRLIYKRANA